MKIFALLLAIVAVVQGKPAFTTSKALNVRGGGSLGPLDADMVATVGSAALASYIGGSAAKFVAGQAGGSAPALADFLTNDVMGILALANAVATGAYFIGDTGFDPAKAGVILTGIAIAQKVQGAGGIDKLGDVFAANRVLSLLFLSSVYVTFA